MPGPLDPMGSDEIQANFGNLEAPSLVLLSGNRSFHCYHTTIDTQNTQLKKEISLMAQAKVGQKAPDFTMAVARPGDTAKTVGSKVSLSDYSGKWLVLFFYPLDFTFVCPTEITALSDRFDEFEETGAEVLGVSIDSVYSHMAWMNTPRDQHGLGELKFPLASDITKSVAADYGVLIEDAGIALRGLFIIDPNGVLQYAVVNSLNIGRSTEETLRVLMALQTGGLCPSDWKPGKALLTV